MGQAPSGWVRKTWEFPRRVLSGTLALGKRGYGALKRRYGPRYTYAMMIIAFCALFSPVPGSTLLGVGAVAAVAEAHRAVSRRGGFRRIITDLANSAAGNSRRELIMPVNCDVILRWGATPEQLTALGAALWRRCVGTAGGSGIYQYLDNQPLADLLAGKLPGFGRAPWQAEARGVHFRFRDETSRDAQAALAGLRREIPAPGVADILVDGRSWAG